MKRILWLRLLLFVGLIAISVVGYLFLLSLFRNYGAGKALAAGFLGTACFVVNVAFFRAEGRTVGDIGFNAPRLRMTQFGLGFLAGGVLVFSWAIIILLIGSGHWRFHSGFSMAGAAALVVFYFFNNAGEELAYRGYAFLRLEERFGRGCAIVTTSVAFALMHFQGGMSFLSALVGVLTNGLIFAVLFSRWKSLPLVLGFHLATNIFQDIYGLRQTALSLAEFKSVNAVGGREIVILALVGGLNLVILFYLSQPLFRRRTRHRSHAKARCLH